MERAAAELIARAYEALPVGDRPRVAACMLALLTRELGGDPTVDRVVRQLAAGGTLLAAKRSWAAYKRQFKASGLADDPRWKDALAAIGAVVAGQGSMGYWTVESLAKAMLGRDAREQAHVLAACVDEALCGAWDRADASDLVAIMAALGMRRGLALALSEAGLALLPLEPNPLAEELASVLYATGAWARGVGPPPPAVDPVFRWNRRGGGYLASGAAYTAWIPSAPAVQSYASGARVAVAQAAYTAVDSYSRVRALTAEDPGGWKGQGAQKAALADVMRAAVPCPSAREALDEVEG
jgi:hypothetical protein